jgi:hypothetical protein
VAGLEVNVGNKFNSKYAWRDSNSRPFASKATALSAELQAQVRF